MDWLVVIVQSVIGGVITGGAAYAAIKVEIRWLRRDVDEARKDVRHAHRRIDDFAHRPSSS